MYRNKSNANEDYGSKYEGYVVDLIEKIAQELNFTYEFHLTEFGGNGNYDPNSQTWNGIMGDVLSGVSPFQIIFWNLHYILSLINVSCNVVWFAIMKKLSILLAHPTVYTALD